MARVLVVEDEQDLHDLIAIRLLMVGHCVAAAPNAAGALDTVDRAGAPDAYVLDVGLPDLDGFRLLDRLRDGGDGAPAIFLSGHAREREARLGRAMGATYLTKPFEVTSLMDALDEALAARPGAAADHAW